MAENPQMECGSSLPVPHAILTATQKTTLLLLRSSSLKASKSVCAAQMIVYTLLLMMGSTSPMLNLMHALLAEKCYVWDAHIKPPQNTQTFTFLWKNQFPSNTRQSWGISILDHLLCVKHFCSRYGLVIYTEVSHCLINIKKFLSNASRLGSHVLFR